MRRLVPVFILLAVGTAALLRVVGVGVNIATPLAPSFSARSSDRLAQALPSATPPPPSTATLEPQASAVVELPAVAVQESPPFDLLGQLGDVLRSRAAAEAPPEPPAEESPSPAPTSTVQPAAASAPPPRPAPTATLVPPPPPPPASLGGLAQEMFAAHNSSRALNGVGPLALDGALSALAQQRAQDMVNRGYFSHTSPTGETAFTLLQGAGISYKFAGENIGNNNYPDSESVTVAMSGFLGSSTHRTNLLNGNFTRVGIGVAHSGDRKYFAVIFVG